VDRLALLDTGMRSQNESERAIRRARIRLANEGHFELVLGLQMSRFIPAYRARRKQQSTRIQRRVVLGCRANASGELAGIDRQIAPAWGRMVKGCPRLAAVRQAARTHGPIAAPR
jgi:hypothetical protein